MTPSIFFILFLIFVTSVFDTINQLFLKSAINSLDFPIHNLRKVGGFVIKLLLVPRIWIGFSCTGISLIIWLYILSKADLNFAFSADSMHYVLIALTARLFLKEKVSWKRWLGTIFIIVGITLLTISNQ